MFWPFNWAKMWPWNFALLVASPCSFNPLSLGFTWKQREAEEFAGKLGRNWVKLSVLFWRGKILMTGAKQLCPPSAETGKWSLWLHGTEKREVSIQLLTARRRTILYMQYIAVVIPPFSCWGQFVLLILFWSFLMFCLQPFSLNQGNQGHFG